MTDRKPGRTAVASLVTAGAVMLAAGCGRGPEPPAHQTAAAQEAAGLRALAARYLAIALPANRQLDHDFDGLTGQEGDEDHEGDLAAAAASLRRLRGYQPRLDAANEPVEDAVRVIRGQLGLPPPDTS